MVEIFGSWITAVLFFLVVICTFFWLGGKRSKLRLPPGPPPYPVIGNLHQLSHHFYRDFARLGKKYGPLMYLKLGAVPVVVVQNAALAREITKTQDHMFAHRPQDLSCVRILLYEGDDVGFAPIGGHWRHLRKLLATELFLPKRLNTFKNQRLEEVLATMRAMMEGSKQGGTVNVQDHMKALMYNVVTRMVAGKTFYGSEAASPNERETFQTLMVDFFAVFNHFNIGDWFPYLRILGDLQGTEKKMTSVAARFENFLQGCIDEHRNNKRKVDPGAETEQVKDFVDFLLDVPGEDDGHFGDRNIRIILQSSFIAGTETSSSVLQWSLTELIRHPRLMKKVQEEVDQVVGRERLVQEDDVPHLKLLGAVVKETLRLHPPGPFLLPRQPIQDCKVRGFDIPSNVRLFVSIWAIGRDPAAWERPLEFVPERFLDNPIDFNGSYHEYLPFGSGRRICPGRNLGLIMISFQLAHIVHLCNYSLGVGHTVDDMDMSEAPGFNLPKRVPLEVVATPRLASDFYKNLLHYEC